ncbi:hypothetical protein ACFL3M_03220, partial [Patescibacteria group bacterium]
YLILPMLYNLRHGLELLIKFMSVDPKSIHDLFEINPQIINQLKCVPDKERIIACKRLGVNNDDFNLYIEKIVPGKLNELMNKYQCEYATSDIADLNNTHFRYCFDRDLINRILDNGIANIQEDIEWLVGFAFIFVFCFSESNMFNNGD